MGKIEKVAEAEEEMDAMLAMDDEADMARQSERARLQRESASKFLQRQKDKCVEAQRREKKRSLAVTGRILKVLSDKSNESMDAEDLMAALPMCAEDGDGEAEEEMVFLHTLSKSKRKKMKRDKLAMAYGVQQKPKKKKKKAPRADKGLGSFLQIGQIKMC